jgi:hypothetical protein
MLGPFPQATNRVGLRKHRLSWRVPGQRQSDQVRRETQAAPQRCRARSKACPTDLASPYPHQRKHGDDGKASHQPHGVFAKRGDQSVEEFHRIILFGKEAPGIGEEVTPGARWPISGLDREVGAAQTPVPQGMG